MKTLTTIPPLFRRGIVFLVLFLIISGIIGPRIISGGILYRDGFAIYGSLGKAAIFGLIAFVLLVRHAKRDVRVVPWRLGLLGWLAASAAAFVFMWAGVDNLLAGQQTPDNLVLAHGSLILCIVFATIGCFGVSNLRLLYQNYRRELLCAGLCAALFYLFLYVVYALWQPLAVLVLWAVKGLLDISGIHGIILPPTTLMFDKFGITIAQYCSGIESIALFSGLYVIVGLLDWPRVRAKRFFIVFPFALIALCALNIWRVYALIMAGYYINPEIAFSLFHTYAGLVFFILYSALFWVVAYKYIFKNQAEIHR